MCILSCMLSTLFLKHKRSLFSSDEKGLWEKRLWEKRLTWSAALTIKPGLNISRGSLRERLSLPASMSGSGACCSRTSRLGIPAPLGSILLRVYPPSLVGFWLWRTVVNPSSSTLRSLYRWLVVSRPRLESAMFIACTLVVICERSLAVETRWPWANLSGAMLIDEVRCSVPVLLRLDIWEWFSNSIREYGCNMGFSGMSEALSDIYELKQLLAF